MENAVYYVASPEACAAILWKSRDKAGTVGHALHAALSTLRRALHAALCSPCCAALRLWGPRPAQRSANSSLPCWGPY